MNNKIIFEEFIEAPYWILLGTQNQHQIAKRVNTNGNLPSIKQRKDAKKQVIKAFSERVINAA